MKKQNSDDRSVSELLKKLQASYLGGDKKDETDKSKKLDREERDFQSKLAEMLGKATRSTPSREDEMDPHSLDVTDAHSDSSEVAKAEQESLSEAEKNLPQPDSEAPVATPKKVKASPKKAAVKKPKKEFVKAASKLKEESTPVVPVESPVAVEEAPVVIEEEPSVKVEQATVEEETVAVEEAPVIVEEEAPVIVEEEAPVIVDEEPVESEHIHPLDKVLPLESEQTSVAETVSDPLPSVPEAHDAKESTPFAAVPQSDTPVLPQKSTQNVTVIKAPSDSTPRASSKDERSDSIVIRPRNATPPPSVATVIRPRNTKKQIQPPTLIQKSPSAEPIIIGKEANADIPAVLGNELPNMKEDKTNVTPTPVPEESVPKRPPSISAIRQAPPTPVADSTPEKATVQTCTAKKSDAPKADSKKSTQKADATLPRSTSSTAKSTEKTPAKKKPKKSAAVKKSSDYENENLEETLDDAVIDSALLIEEIPADEPEEIPVHTQKRARSRKKSKTATDDEQSLPALDLICKKSGLTKDDVAMMFELGYENELGRLVGYDTLKRMKAEHLRMISKDDRAHYRTAFGYRGEELSGDAHKEAVTAAYLHDRGQLIVRLCLSLLISVLLLFADLPHLLGAPLIEFDLQYPHLLRFIGLILLGIDAILSRKQISAGLRAFFNFTATPYSVIALTLPIGLLYGVFALFAKNPMLPSCFIVSLTLLATAICDVLRISCEMRALPLVTVSGVKHVLVKATPRKKKLKQGDRIVKVINDDLGENLYQLKDANHTVGFFRRFNEMGSAVKPFTALLLTMLSLATLLFFVTALATSSLSASLSNFMAVLLATTPLSALFTYFYPLVRANRVLAQKRCALIGEESVSELDEDWKTLILRDTQLFTATKRAEFSVRSSDDLRGDLRLVGILFRKLGGTTEQLSKKTLLPINDPPVSILRIKENGVEAVVDGKHHMLLGDAEFLQRERIRVPKESSDAALRRTESTAVMYVAINGTLKLSYEIEYTVDKNLEQLIYELAESDTSVAISSYDPCLNDAFLQKSRPSDEDPIRVIKLGRFEEDKPIEVTDTGAVALENQTDLIYPIHAAKGIGKLRGFGWRIQFVASLVGTLAILLLTLIGLREYVGILSIAVYQLFWVLVTLFATHTELNRDKLHFQENNESKNTEETQS